MKCLREFIIKQGWEDAGTKGTIIGNNVTIHGILWTPVLLHGEEDPEFLKTSSLELLGLIRTGSVSDNSQ